MGLIGNGIQRLINAAVWAGELYYEITDRPFRQPLEANDGQLLIDEGPDDVWPEDPKIAQSDPEVLVGQQWGIQLPNGQVEWNVWQGIHFQHPIDRVRLVATLQKVAHDMGLPEGEETEKFLSKYQWVTRNQIATVVYEETGAYPLADPQVSALGTPEAGGSSHGVNNENSTEYATSAVNGQGPDPGVRPGSVGSDA